MEHPIYYALLTIGPMISEGPKAYEAIVKGDNLPEPNILNHLMYWFMN